MRKIAILCLIGALALCSAPLMASTFVAMSHKQLVAQADTIVQGQVVGVDSFWSESGRLIVTEARVKVHETLLGTAPAEVTVRTFGGQVGNFAVEAPGFPKFEEGREVILFLTLSNDDGSIRVLGYQQGHYRVVERLDGVTVVAPQVEDGVRYLKANGKLAAPARSYTLDEFRAGIRDLAIKTGRLAGVQLSK